MRSTRLEWRLAPECRRVSARLPRRAPSVVALVGGIFGCRNRAASRVEALRTEAASDGLQVRLDLPSHSVVLLTFLARRRGQQVLADANPVAMQVADARPPTIDRPNSLSALSGNRSSFDSLHHSNGFGGRSHRAQRRRLIDAYITQVTIKPQSRLPSLPGHLNCIQRELIGYRQFWAWDWKNSFAGAP